MRRKKRPQDSLELFLDAICNMFGGFLFLMLFVVVSTRMTRDSSVERELQERNALAEADFLEAQEEWDDLVARRELIVRRAEQTKDLIDRLNDPEVAKIRQETFDNLESVRKISSENEQTERELQEIERRKKELDREQRTLKEKIVASENDARQTMDDADDALREKARKTAAPQMRLSYKNEIPVIVKYGRSYFWRRREGRKWTEQLNTDDFVIVEEKADELRTEPKPWRGVDLNAVNLEKKLEEAFDGCDPKRDKISIVVASDSYVEYGFLRDFLKKRNFDVRPIVGKEGTFVADRGGTNQKAQ